MSATEYVTKKVQRGRAGDRAINKMAADGWELVDRIAQLNAFDRVTFKRTKP